MMDLSYVECEAYILNIPRVSNKHTLEDVREFLKFIGNPGMTKKLIHVAGTNGKGSVCAYLQSMIQTAGISVGMFTSPHLVTMRERITVSGTMISETEFVASFQRMIKAIEQFAERREEYFHPSFFEFMFLMAMDVFERKDTEYIILETGLGGRLDATNVIDNPEVCVITEIGYDHMEYLGSGLTEIAGEKAGIMKPGVPVVAMDKRREVTEKLTETAAGKGCPLFLIKPEDIKINEIENKTIDFSFHSRYYMYVRLLLSTKAFYQTENAAMAVQTLELIQETRITREHIYSGLKSTCWPGRMEEIRKGIFLDGAHNEDGIQAFLESVEADACKGKRYLLFGGVREKQYQQIIGMLAESGLFEEAAAVPLETIRSLSAYELKETFLQYMDLPCTVCADVREALDLLEQKKQENDMIYITGSLYLAGQVKSGEENAG